MILRKKIKTFAELEMPLLIEKRFLDKLDLSVFTQNLITYHCQELQLQGPHYFWKEYEYYRL